MKPWALPVETFKEWYTPNPERAKKLLAEAGFPSGFKTTLKVIPTFPTMVAGAQVIAAQLKKIGVDAQIIQEEYGVWIKAITKPTFDFDLTMNITNSATPIRTRSCTGAFTPWRSSGTTTAIPTSTSPLRGQAHGGSGQAQGGLR